jgi:hypothetical protein
LVSCVISSGVTIAGPMGANVSKDLPICTGTGGHSGKSTEHAQGCMDSRACTYRRK